MFYIPYFIFFNLLFIFGSGYDFSNGEDSKYTKVFPFRFVESKDLDQLKRESDFNALNDYHRSMEYGLNTPYKETFFEDGGNKFQDHRKKSDSRPKYDPGWKFIGLGKRPEIDELPYLSNVDDTNSGVNPFLGISTLINFEFFNAIKDNIENAEKDTVKKEHSMSSSGLSGDDSGSLRYNNKLNLFSGRQKSMYDPGWMLTGLGK